MRFRIDYAPMNNAPTTAESAGGRMSEYIITDKQLQTATEAYLEHELSRPITEVFISGDKLPEIVRCRDCLEYEPYHTYGGMKLDFGMCMKHEQETSDYRFCAWGERREA